MGKRRNKSGNERGRLESSTSIAAVVAAAAATPSVFESLEARQLMSVSWSSGNLTVNGSGNADTIVVETMDINVPGFVLVKVTENNVVTQPLIPFVTGKSLKVNGNGGADTINCEKVCVKVTVDGGAGNDTIKGGSAGDSLKGGADNDTIYGNGGDDTLDGGTQDDLLVGGAGADKFIGGSGTDTVSYSGRTATLYLTIDGVPNDGEILELDNIGTDVENLIGGTGNDVIAGNGSSNKLMGNGGSDIIYGGGGDDTIYGGLDTDVFTPGQIHNDRDQIHGGDGADHLHAPVNGSAEIHGDKNNDFIYGSYGRDWLHGDDGDDSIEGGWGDDLLWGGKGDDLLKGGKGDDTLVAIGGGNKDQLWGGDGFDSFWLDQPSSPYVEAAYDPSMEEISAGHVHNVDKFHDLDINPFPNPNVAAVLHFAVPLEPDGQDLIDPIMPSGATGWKDFSDHPLFPDLVGPVAGDIRQGNVGDCYFGVALSGLAQTNKDRIKQSVVDLGDGTYACQFVTDQGTQFYRVDGELPVDGNGKPISLGLGKDGAIWTAILEKAFAFARADQGTYSSLNGGTVDEGYTLLGCDNALQLSRNAAFNGATDLITWIGNQRAAGKPVSIGTWDSLNGDAGPVVEDHAYDVVKVNKDGFGNFASIELRNPWGIDGKNDGSNPNDGYVTLTKSQLFAAVQTVWTADV